MYKEKFRDYDLAEARLQTLLANEPEEKLILPAKYNLYKIYELTESTALEAVKQDIIQNHPDSRYAQILLNPSVATEASNESPEARYVEVYRLVKSQDYETAISKADEYINQFNGEDIVPKFEMLKASAVARLDGFEAYKEALNYVALTYPNNPEGKDAQSRIDNELKMLVNKSLDTTSTLKSKLVLPFSKSEKVAAEELAEELKRALIDLDYRKHSVSVDVYDREKLFVVVHGFTALDRAQGFAELLKVNKDYRIDLENFVISNPNYRKIQIHKNLNEYLDNPQTQ